MSRRSQSKDIYRDGRMTSDPWADYLHDIRFCRPPQWSPMEHVDILHRHGKKVKKTFVTFQQRGKALTSTSGVARWQRVEDARYDRKVEAALATGEWEALGPRHDVTQGTKEMYNRGIRIDEVTGLEPFAFITALAGERDVYMSMSRYWLPQRKKKFVKEIAALYVDIDRPKESAKHWRPEVELAKALNTLRDAKKPLPSYAMYSGRGINLVWLLQSPLPVQATGRWQSVARRLVELLSVYNVDVPASLDVCRTFRISGTVNSKSGDTVTPLWIQGDPYAPFRHDFDVLNDALQPMDRESYLLERRMRERSAWSKTAAGERKDIRRSKDGQRHSRSQPTAKLTARSGQQRLSADLDLLREHRWGNGEIPSGARDSWLYCYTVALAWTMPPHALERSVRALGREIGWSETEAVANMSSVLDRAREAQHLQERQAGGEGIGDCDNVHGAKTKQDTRYRLSAEAVIERLAVSEQEIRELNLRYVITPEIRAERERERMAASRGQETTPMSREERKLTTLRRDWEIMEIIAANAWSVRKAAAELGMSSSTIGRIVRRLRPC
ncbi:hypothetical protein CLG85_025300 [Yangia mangrovi]|uniref:Replication protein n=2 Tax=Alloyangia mangrovi TaxID=1779329 RepID=A0ABT2KVB1_9RHOB|nr:hypothetical protein [Alloyangia mangrovi]MCT4373432.1 hypothetical protein [Alloyangia mangrovi]